MAKYKRKPETVDAMYYHDSKEATEAIERWVGPHMFTYDGWSNQTPLELFDIVTKSWKRVPDAHYIVKRSDNSLDFMPKAEFEYQFEPVVSIRTPYIPHPTEL